MVIKMSIKTWSEVSEELELSYHTSVIDDLIKYDWTENGDAGVLSGDRPWAHILDWAERVQKDTGYDLQSIYEAIQDGNSTAATDLLRSLNRYSSRSAKYYNREPRSYFGVWADGLTH